MKINILILSFLLISNISCGQIKTNKPRGPQTLPDVEIDYMLRGYIYASSSIIDTNAIGGFGKSDHMPQKISEGPNFTETGFFLKIDTNEFTSFAKKYCGYHLYLVNKSDSIVPIPASDSRLSMIAEAWVDNVWQPIEYLPSSWCGNSYHTVYLAKKEYLDFTIPKYNGKIKTKIRYKLTLDNKIEIYSNEISGGINKKQLTEKQGHNPQGLMDPYND